VTVATAPIVVVVAVVPLARLKIATEIVAQKRGLAMDIAMMEHISGTEFRSISTVTNSVMTVVIAANTFLSLFTYFHERAPHLRGSLFSFQRVQ
jgi:hypothetical protein